MKVTARQVRAAYEFLSKLPPFSGWGMPDSAQMGFAVLRTKRWQGDYECRRRPRIRVSSGRVCYADRLLVVVAHEMVHLRTNMLRKRVTHSPLFQKLARQVCAELGFDPHEF